MIILFVLLGNCETDNKDSACGITNPIKNLSWLNQLKNNLQNDPNIASAEIIIYTKQSTDYFLVKQKISLSYDFPGGLIYNCIGELKFTCGGNQPIDSCSIFLLDAQKIKTLWQK
jgi:hypothetical protein